MYTLHHGFWMYFFTRHHGKVWQFVAGSMLPDYIYIVLVILMLVQGQIGWTELLSMSPAILMSFLPLHPWVVNIDLLGHSVVVWGAFFLCTLLPVVNQMQSFAVGWGSHLLVDGLTHGAYANYYLYPLSLSAVHSPVSYWEPQYLAHEFKLVNNTLMALVALYLIYSWWRKKYRK
ncbi:MAG: hypothetical protein ABFC84_18060 [Veillonellales bacterium]